jgi:hypothetical protein
LEVREMRKFELQVTQELVDYVQRLGYEVDGYAYIISQIFDQHKNDVDDSVISSVPFKSYQTKYAKIKSEYEIAKMDLEKEIKKLVAEKTSIEDPKFDWEIKNFSDLTVDITLAEEE